MRLVETLALILTFSPGEKEQPSPVSVFWDGCPANPVADSSVRRRKILPLLGGEGRGEGERETFFPAKTQLRAGQDKSGGERADTSRRSLTEAEVQTLREVRGRPAVAKRLECAWL